MKTKDIFIALVVLFSVNSYAQLLKHTFDEKGETYIQAGVRGQFWGRYVATNPGTTINKEPVSETFDFSVRRYRISFQAQIKKNLFFYMQLGNNNINQKTIRSSDVRLLDMLGEYTFSNKFKLGVGKLSFTGAGRFVDIANGSMLNLDPSVHQLFTLNQLDDTGRNIGIYAKGQLGKFDYNVSIHSMAIPTDAQVTDFNYSRKYTSLGYSTYVKYEFLEDESNRTPYSGGVGTYIGKKKILNIGVGYGYKSKMFERTVGANKTYDDHRNLGIDFFMDMPISAKNNAITAYLGYNNLFFGEDYVRNIGVNSIFDSSGTSFNGGGNAFPVIGTGNTLLLQLGYLLSKSEKNNTRYQPYFGWKLADFEGLNQSVNSYALGLNVYFNGHRSKLTFGYHNRPIFDATTKKVDSRKGTYVIQYQIEI